MLESATPTGMNWCRARDGWGRDAYAQRRHRHSALDVFVCFCLFCIAQCFSASQQQTETHPCIFAQVCIEEALTWSLQTRALPSLHLMTSNCSQWHYPPGSTARAVVHCRPHLCTFWIPQAQRQHRLPCQSLPPRQRAHAGWQAPCASSAAAAVAVPAAAEVGAAGAAPAAAAAAVGGAADAALAAGGGETAGAGAGAGAVAALSH
eukprot:1153969-Pelagomonas_calceolata.AAC.3